MVDCRVRCRVHRSVHQRISAARITERAGAYLAVGELEQLHHSLNVGHQLVVRLVALLGRRDLDELRLEELLQLG